MSVDLTKLQFSSLNRYERVYMKGSVSHNTASGGFTPITHNLGYIPYFRLFVKYPNRSSYSIPIAGVEPDDYLDYRFEYGAIDSTKIEVAITNLTGDPDSVIPVYYRIYAEPQTA